MNENKFPPLPNPKFTETIRGVPCIAVTEHEHLMRAYAQQARAQVQGEPIGEVGTMPGTSGFTMACFRADEVPVGTKIYTAPQPAQATQAEATQAEETVDPIEDAIVRKLQVITLGQLMLNYLDALEARKAKKEGA